MLNYITEQPLTEPLVEEFLQAELKAGASSNSVKRYRGDLVQLRRFLGEDAVVRRGTLQAWMQSMQQAGYAPRTVCARIDTANRFLYQLGVPELCQQPPRCAIQPTLAMTKEEYAALLETAKSQKCDRIALLLRLFAETAMPVQGVEAVTVEAVQADMVVVKLPRALWAGAAFPTAAQRPAGVCAAAGNPYRSYYQQPQRTPADPQQRDPGTAEDGGPGGAFTGEGFAAVPAKALPGSQPACGFG